MKTNYLILLTLKYSNKNMIAGRTLFQKTLYFIAEKTNLNLEFVPHYYGPYSTTISEELGDLCAAGLLTESSESFTPLSFGVAFEPRKYTYRLTEKGREVADFISNQEPEIARSIKDTLEEMRRFGAIDDYRSLSVAAKMYHILKSKKQMKPIEILNEAKALQWSIDIDEAKSAIEFLEKMKLVQVKKE
jgi:uncharacterized protein